MVFTFEETSQGSFFHLWEDLICYAVLMDQSWWVLEVRAAASVAMTRISNAASTQIYHPHLTLIMLYIYPLYSQLA